MKADRRHQLQDNELAKWAAPKVEAVKPYGLLILGIIVAVVAIVVTIVLIQNSYAAEQEEQWAKVMRLTSNEYFVQQAQKRERDKGTQLDALEYETINDEIENELKNVIAEDDTTLAALRGKLFLADRARTRGINAIFNDRVAAPGELTDAIELYEEIAASAEENTVRSRAEFYLADTLVARSGLGDLSDLQRAKGIYENLSSQGMFAQAAAEQLAILNRTSFDDGDGEEEYFAWFHNELERLENSSGSTNTGAGDSSGINTSTGAPTTSGTTGLGGITDTFDQSTGGTTGPVVDPPNGGK